MMRYILRRLVQLIPVLVGVLFFTFAIQQVTPGDPARLVLGPRASPAAIAELRTQLGLDDPLWLQFGRYLVNAVQGDLGKTIRGQQPVLAEIMRRFPATWNLTLAAMTFAAVAGIGLGIVAATTARRWLQAGVMSFALVGLSIPAFWLAIMLVLLFGVQLRWVSVTGGEGWRNLILPAFALGLGPAAVLLRMTRSSILEVLRNDYVRTARAKGLAERLVIGRHVLRNSLIPVVTVLGLQFAATLGGSVFIESVFALNGLGRFTVAAVAARDYPVVQGITLFTALIYVVANLLVDLLYGVLNPRIRYE